MRVLPPAGAAALAVAATVLLASPASAHNAPGDNGTIKIHATKTAERLIKNEPHVCTFYLDAFHFDGLQQAAWKIVEWPPTGTKDKLALSGDITLDGNGHGRTDDLALADGHYKLEWNFNGENGHAKQKVFWVDCPAQGTTAGGSTSGTTSGGSNGGTTTGTTAGSTAGGSSTGTTTGGGTTAGSAGATSTPTPAASASATAGTGGSSDGSSSGSLASTGASVIGLSTVAALLLGAGVAVRFRRRGSRQ